MTSIQARVQEAHPATGSGQGNDTQGLPRPGLDGPLVDQVLSRLVRAGKSSGWRGASTTTRG